MTQDKIVSIDGRFKSVDQFNQTIHIILYAYDLKAVVALQEMEIGTPVNVTLQNKEAKP